MSGIKIDDQAFLAGFTDHMERLRANSRAGMKRYGESAVTFADAHIHTVSGELAGALGVEDHTDEEPPYVEIGAFETGPDPHGLDTEYGTSKEAPHPFIRPALEEAARDFTVDE